MLERLLEQQKVITTANVELNVSVELQTSHWVLASLASQTIPQPTVIWVDGMEGSGTLLTLFLLSTHGL